MKYFESSDFKEIEAELLRLMRNPRCYAISTFGFRRGKAWRRVRLIRRRSEMLWVSEYNYYHTHFHDSPHDRRMEPSCFNEINGKIRPMSAEHIAFCAAAYSKGESTIVIGWFA